MPDARASHPATGDPWCRRTSAEVRSGVNGSRSSRAGATPAPARRARAWLMTPTKYLIGYARVSTGRPEPPAATRRARERRMRPRLRRARGCEDRPTAARRRARLPAAGGHALRLAARPPGSPAPPPDRDRHDAHRSWRRAAIGDRGDRHRQRRRPADLPHLRSTRRVRALTDLRAHARRPRGRPCPRPARRTTPGDESAQARRRPPHDGRDRADGRPTYDYNEIAAALKVSRSTVVRHVRQTS